MRVRRLCAATLASAVLLAAGCGDDEEDKGGGTGTTTKQAAALLPEDVPPSAAAPNLKGAGDDIESVAKTFAGKAMEYFDKVFSQNGRTYRHPELAVLATPGDNGCGQTFDPAQEGVFLCLTPSGGRLTMGGPYLERARDQHGDAAAVFLIGYGVALSAYDQATGDRLAKGGKVDEEFIHAAACLAGAWNRWMTKQRLFEAGDEEELLKLAEGLIPGRTEEGVSLGQDIVAAGYLKGSGACKPQEAN